MAARRLLILLLAVLAISTIGAALIAPQPADPPPARTTTQGDSRAPPREAGGRLIEASVRVRRARPETIRLHPGDQLELTVRSRTPGQVSVPRFGLLEDAGPDEPAELSLLVDEPGDFHVRFAPGGGTVAHIVAAPARRSIRRPRGPSGHGR